MSGRSCSCMPNAAAMQKKRSGASLCKMPARKKRLRKSWQRLSASAISQYNPHPDTAFHAHEGIERLRKIEIASSVILTDHFSQSMRTAQSKKASRPPVVLSSSIFSFPQPAGSQSFRRSNAERSCSLPADSALPLISPRIGRRYSSKYGSHLAAKRSVYFFLLFSTNAASSFSSSPSRMRRAATIRRSSSFSTQVTSRSS